MEKNNPPVTTFLPTQLLASLIADLDDETVTALILHGSYARGDALPPYSDVDLVRILYEREERKQSKRFIWYDGYLLNLSSRPLSIYKEWLTIPQEAVFRISTIRDAQILLDKEGAFGAFQQAMQQWRWEPLQDAANRYASQVIVELSETVLRVMRALQFQQEVMLLQRICLHLLPGVTRAMGVGQGIIAHGNNYLQQIQDHLGADSAWTCWYLQAAGITRSNETLSLWTRGIAALQLYQETVRLLHPSLLPEHRETLLVLTNRVDQMLSKHAP